MTAGRSAITAQQQVVEARALADTAAGLVTERAGLTVCCYVPFGPEPGSIALLDVLRSGGARVLLPVIPDTPGPLDWAEYTGTSSLVAGPYRGVLEPSGPRLGPAGVAEAGLVLVPALGVDRRGVRLGRGGGYYDRSLVLASPGTELMAAVRDDELVERLPADPHDVRMTAALTPGYGVVRLAGDGATA
ncbi:5-formyltetrahydrofolate cyclo-ligase [Prauserella muralis]|uniref:5-formyltetrahydrofolate cyclo-ligase n=1 Tax=Prauserella muralis TaxID=588067 RepID=A0A2V4BC20_9PSEU|nr:5-formyltetrahydrofolate cyclo-ligase [Prauserella muralis]